MNPQCHPSCATDCNVSSEIHSQAPRQSPPDKQAYKITFRSKYQNSCIASLPTARIDHGTTCGIQESSEFWITSCHVANVGKAAIQLDIVHIPVRKGLRIEFHVMYHTRIAGTGICAKVLVQTEFQSSVVDLYQ